jgi:phosphate:Na+ symporter
VRKRPVKIGVKYVWFLQSILSKNIPIATRIAFSHTTFNIFIVSLFIPFINPLARLILLLVPAKKHSEKPHLTYLDVKIFDAPAIAVKQSNDEINQMGDHISEMFEWLRKSLIDKNNNSYLEKKIFHREKMFDIIQKEVVIFISKLMSGNLPHSVTEVARRQLRIVDEYESISDYIVIILKLYCRIKNKRIQFTKQDENELIDLHDSISKYLQTVIDAVKNNNYDILSNAMSRGDTITHKVKDYRSNYLNRLEAEQTTPLMCMIFMDILNGYRRVKDHTFNVAEVIAGTK